MAGGLLGLILTNWVIASFLVAWAAKEKGRDRIGWFFLSLLCSPLLAMLALIAAPSLLRPSRMRVEGAPRGTEVDPILVEVAPPPKEPGN